MFTRLATSFLILTIALSAAAHKSPDYLVSQFPKLQRAIDGAEYIVGLEGGNVKTDIYVISKSGNELPIHHTSGNQKYRIIGSLDMMSYGQGIVNSTIHNCLDGLEFDNEQGDRVTLSQVIDQSAVIAAVPGTGIPSVHQQLADLLTRYGFSSNRVLVSSVAILGLDLIDAKQGAITVAGTSCICLAKNEHQEVVRAGGILDDDAGGYHMGFSAIHSSLAHEASSGPETRLTQEIKDVFNVNSIVDIVPKINLGKLPRKEIASLSPLIFSLAYNEEPDSVALEIVNHSADYLGSLINQCSDSVNTKEPMNIMFYGGTFKNDNASKYIARILENTPYKDCTKGLCVTTNFAGESIIVHIIKKSLATPLHTA